MYQAEERCRLPLKVHQLMCDHQLIVIVTLVHSYNMKGASSLVHAEQYQSVIATI